MEVSMEIVACPKCGSLKIFQGKMEDGVLTGYTFRFVCQSCRYQGMPIIFNNKKDYNNFLENIKNNKKENNEDISNNKSQKNNFKSKRPFGIIILSVIMIIQAVFSIYIYLTMFNGIALFLWIYYISIFVVSAIILPYGFIKGKGWAWTLGGILFAISIPIGLIFLYYITRKKIKIYFKKLFIF
jgi:hypothetical protein